MARRYKKRLFLSPLYSFAVTWLVLSAIFPLFRIWGFILVVALSSFVAFLFGKNASAKENASKQEDSRTNASKVEAPKAGSVQKKSYGPEIDPILEEGHRALSEMGRLYSSIQDSEVKIKINELMRITDKITRDAIDDPSDIPQIKKFMSYYLPTTIKLLNAYDRMSAQGIEGENLSKSMSSINEMLDAAIVAYKKRLDSLFENQALDIETDIEVMNQMLAREGLIGEKDFKVQTSESN